MVLVMGLVPDGSAASGGSIGRISHWCRCPQGTPFTIDLTQAELAIENSAGLSSRMGWNLYDFWKESKGVFVLVYKVAERTSSSARRLSEVQQGELREMLSSVLPRK